MGEMTALERVCFAWNSASLVEPIPTVVSCRTGILLPHAGEQPRFSFVSVGSPVEQLLSSSSTLRSQDGSPVDVGELCGRLVEGEVAGVLAPVEKSAAGELTTRAATSSLPADFVERRQGVRYDNVQMRFLLRQIGLAEVSSHRGAPAALYRRAQSLWSRDLSICTDPAMMLTLGADRQRYVDPDFEERAFDRLPRALGRLHDLGIRSYPRLVIV